MLIQDVTSSRVHLDYDQAFPRAEFVSHRAADFLHRGSYRHPDGGIGMVHAVHLKQDFRDG